LAPLINHYVNVISQASLVPMEQGYRNQKTNKKFCTKVSVPSVEIYQYAVQTW